MKILVRMNQYTITTRVIKRYLIASLNHVIFLIDLDYQPKLNERQKVKDTY